MTTESPPFVVGRGPLNAAADAVLDGAVVAPAPVISVAVSGSGVVECLQGLLTNDVGAAGTNGFVYGAVLTPKGMIVCDLYVARHGDTTHLFAPAHGREALFDLFKRSLPPRLARTEDVSDAVTVLRLAGPRSHDVARRAGVTIPERGQTAVTKLAGVTCLVARPSVDMPFALQLSTDTERGQVVTDALAGAGAAAGPAEALELARVLAGFPRLGAEIDHKTLPQEVRYEDIDGVSFTKGCYTGQETVARVHFRGHTNRWLAGLQWEDTPDFSRGDVTAERKPVGRVTSAVHLDRLNVFIGLAVVRREIRPGHVLTASGAPATAVALPFSLAA